MVKSAFQHFSRHMSPDERFDIRVRVDSASGCHVWEGARNSPGYGHLLVKGVHMSAHRFAYERAKGPIPEGLTIDHLCRNRACVNPDHLEAVTNRDNVLRGETVPAENAAKTHCKNGHRLDLFNTYVYQTGPYKGWRSCRTCDREWMRRKRAGQ